MQKKNEQKRNRVLITAENKRVIKCSLLILYRKFMIKCICKYDKTPFFNEEHTHTHKEGEKEEIKFKKKE